MVKERYNQKRTGIVFVKGIVQRVRQIYTQANQELIQQIINSQAKKKKGNYVKQLSESLFKNVLLSVVKFFVIIHVFGIKTCTQRQISHIKSFVLFFI